MKNEQESAILEILNNKCKKMKILLIAPKCYPVNGAEAIVNIKMLRAMSEDGNFEIDLVSRRNSKIVYPSDSIDSHGVKIHGLYIIDNKGGFSLRVLWESLLSLFIFKAAFPGCHWAVRALPIINKLIRDNHYDFVLTKSSPSLLLGAYVKKKKGLKWVASWNDPYPMSFYPSPYGKGKDHKHCVWDKLQISLMRKADFHIFPTKALKNYMSSYLHVDEDKCFIIPHVVFEDTVKPVIDSLNDKDNVLRIIHSGNLASPRNPRPVINVISKIVKKEHETKFHFTFLGNMEQDDKDYIDSMPYLKDYVSILPMVEYHKSLEILATQDLACVIEADCGYGGGVFLPTKVTDFMQIHKPMFTVSPKGGVLEDMYKEGSVGYFADIQDENSIYEELMRIFQDYSKGVLKKSRVPESFRPESVATEYKKIAKKIKIN